MSEKNSIFVKSIRNLTEEKETEKFTDAYMPKFGKRSILIVQKIEKLIFATALKTTQSYLLKALTAKKSEIHSSFKPHSFTAFVRRLLFSGEPAYFSRRH